MENELETLRAENARLREEFGWKIVEVLTDG